MNDGFKGDGMSSNKWKRIHAAEIIIFVLIVLSLGYFIISSIGWKKGAIALLVLMGALIFVLHRVFTKLSR
jgi:hypothetical protein